MHRALSHPLHQFMLGRLQRLLPFAFSAAPLQNRPLSAPLTTMSGAAPEIATFASGCFWGVEHIFLKYYPISQNKGILKTSVGYTGGKEDVANPSYRQVCTGTTDHAEGLRIEFDPSIVKYDELVGESPLCTLLRGMDLIFHQSSSTAHTTLRP